MGRGQPLNVEKLPDYGGTRPPAQPNKSLIDGMACLQALAVSGSPIGARALAREMHLEPTRVHRLLKTLACLGVAQQNERGEYEPGPGMHVLAAQSLFGSGLFRKAIAPLEELHRRWSSSTVAMGVLWRLNVCYLYHASPNRSTADALGRVRIAPVTASSIGMALLSSASDDQIRSLFTLEPIEATTAEELVRSARQVRRRGYGRIDVADFAEVSLGVRLASMSNVGIAISGSIPPQDEPKVIADLRQTAAQIG